MRYSVVLVFSISSLFAQPRISRCPSFPANNIWNTAVDALPTDSQSTAFISKIRPTAPLRIDDAIPINIVSRGERKVRVIGMSTPESDPGEYAIPPNARTESGPDSHLIVVDQDTCILYELWASKPSGAAWSAGSGAKWDLNSNALRPDGWTSADAAGLPIMPGILRYDEVAAGQVNHALRVTAPYTRGSGAHQWPARHYASHHPDGPAMGQRFRLKANVDISGYPRDLQVILRGLKKYGVMLADNGMPWGMEHDADPRWNTTDLLKLHRVLGSNMEAVDVSGLMANSDLGIAGPAAGMIAGTDALGRTNFIKLGPGLAIINGVLGMSH